MYSWCRSNLKDKSLTMLIYLLLAIGALVFLLPFFWMISASLKTPSEIYIFPPKWLPEKPMVINYLEAWKRAPFSRFMINTLVVAISVILGQLVTSILAGYAFARLRFPGREILFFIFLTTMMIPSQIRLVPLYLIIKNLHWLDTFYALIIPNWVNVFNIFLLRQFFNTIPKELEEAAQVDGAGYIFILWRIILPLSIPALATVIILTFLFHWNSFFWPLIVISSETKQLIQVGLQYFSSAYGTEINLQMAASVFTIIPVIILFVLAQKEFIQGITTSGMKL